MPVRISITPKNTEFVRKSLEDFTGETIKMTRARLRGRLTAAKNRITKYPPELPHQRYRRTGTYKRAWRIVKLENGYRLYGRAVQKGREYTKYVGGSAYGTKQARIHQGRWTAVRDAVEEALQELPRSIADQIVLVARRRGYR